MSEALFRSTMLGLAKRSAGWRESAAIWAGSVDGENAVASAVFFHHDLCDDRSGPLSLSLSERAKFDLYQTLAGRGMKLVALIHTHPDDWVGLSHVDQRNQICSRIGFWSLVVPFYGEHPWELRTLGVHIRTDSGWYQYLGPHIAERLLITT